MSDKVWQWIPPQMRACTWDEARRMNDSGSLRDGIMQNHNVSAAWSMRAQGVTWLCIDTTEPQHAHEDKPWEALGFEKCFRAEASKDLGGGRLGWEDGIWTRGNPSHDGVVYLKPSPLPGLRRALEALAAWGEGKSGESAMDVIRAEIAKYEPETCGECGRVK